MPTQTALESWQISALSTNQEPQGLQGKRSGARTDVHTRVQTHTEASFKILRKPWVFTVSAVYHFEIYTILAKRTELYCIHDAIKHFTRNQCKTDEAWK